MKKRIMPSWVESAIIWGLLLSVLLGLSIYGVLWSMGKVGTSAEERARTAQAQRIAIVQDEADSFATKLEFVQDTEIAQAPRLEGAGLFVCKTD